MRASDGLCLFFRAVENIEFARCFMSEIDVPFEVPVFDQTGESVGVFSLDRSLITRQINAQLLHDAVVMYQSNLRQGSAKSKTRAEVAGHKKKMYRQKGTGNARAGHKRSGVRRGGGHIFAKAPRDWFYRIPKKALKLATKMAFASKVFDSQLLVVESLNLESPKTKPMAALLERIEVSGSVLLAIDSFDSNVYKSFRNIEGVRVLPVTDLNAFEILRTKKLLFTKGALERFIHLNPVTNQSAVEETEAV